MQPRVAAFTAEVVGGRQHSTLLEVEDFFLGERAEFDEGAAEINEVFHGWFCIWV